MSRATDELERQMHTAGARFRIFQRITTLVKGDEALKIRFFIRPRFFVQVYADAFTGTRNFALIMDERRIYGRDCQRCRNWHRHPFDQPDAHNTSPAGSRPVGVEEFLEEVQEIVEREELL